MQNNYLYHPPTTARSSRSSSSNSSAGGTDHFHQNDDEHVFLSTAMMTNNNVEKVEEREHNDQKQIEIRVVDDDDEKNNKSSRSCSNSSDKSFQQVTMPDESSPSFFDDRYSDSDHHQQQQQSLHTNSHDSLLQVDHDLITHMNTAASSTDDLSLVTHHLSASAFHSKDSALGLSDDNLNYVPSNPLITMPDEDDDDDDDDDDGEHQTSLPSLSIPPSQSKYQIDQCFLFSISLDLIEHKSKLKSSFHRRCHRHRRRFFLFVTSNDDAIGMKLIASTFTFQ